jgi:hypothetical protein
MHVTLVIHEQSTLGCNMHSFTACIHTMCVYHQLECSVVMERMIRHCAHAVCRLQQQSHCASCVDPFSCVTRWADGSCVMQCCAIMMAQRVNVNCAQQQRVRHMLFCCSAFTSSGAGAYVQHQIDAPACWTESASTLMQNIHKFVALSRWNMLALSLYSYHAFTSVA